MAPVASANRATPLLDARMAGQEATKPMLEQAAKDNLFLHFTQHKPLLEGDLPIIVRAEGHHFWDIDGKKYLDGISSLFSVNAGHGRHELATAAYEQMRKLDYFPIWSHAHPTAIELSERILSYAPKNLTRVFFTSGGGEGNETAWKLAKQYFKLQGKPLKHKVLTRSVAYHGTSHGALSLTGIPAMKKAFEPLVPSTFRVPNTNWYRAQDQFDTEEEFALWAADRVEEMILFEDPDTVAAFILEPVQNSGGCFTAPDIYFKRIREICDKYDVLIVADETIDGFGRCGEMFASNRYGFEPDMLVCAKGLTSAYAPLGALLLAEKLLEAGVPPGTISIVPGSGRVLGQLLVTMVLLLPLNVGWVLWSGPGGETDYNRRITIAPFDFFSSGSSIGGLLRCNGSRRDMRSASMRSVKPVPTWPIHSSSPSS